MILSEFLPKIEAALANSTATPQREAVIVCQKYSRDLNELMGRILEAGKPDNLQEATTAAKAFADRHKVYFAAWISARGKIKNPLVCKGPYSPKNNKKALEAESKRYAPQCLKLSDGITMYAISGGRGVAVKYEGTTPAVAAANLKEKGFVFDYEREHWEIQTGSETATAVILNLLNG